MATKEEVWAAADAILDSGSYPTNSSVRAALHCGMSDAAEHMGSWREANPREDWEKQQAIAVREAAELSTPTPHNSSREAATLLEEQQQRDDADAQVSAARTLVAKTYYEQTGEFTVPGLKEEVNRAQKSIRTAVNSQKEAVFPKWMSDRLSNLGK